MSSAVTSSCLTPKPPASPSPSSKTRTWSWSKGFGSADVAKRRPVTPQTLFRLASVSKPLTATGAMQLLAVRQARPRCADPKILPAISREAVSDHHPRTARPPRRHPPLQRRRRRRRELQHQTFANPIAGGIQFFANDPLVEIPGAKFHYTTMGYTLVGCAMEGASGDTYVDVHAEKCFRAGEDVAHRGRRQHRADPRAHQFLTRPTGKVVVKDALPMDSSYKIPGGGWLSSADDIAAYEIAMLDNALVTEKTRDLMWTPQTLTNGQKDDYGYGFHAGSVGGICSSATPAASKAPAPTS